MAVANARRAQRSGRTRLLYASSNVIKKEEIWESLRGDLQWKNVVQGMPFGPDIRFSTPVIRLTSMLDLTRNLHPLAGLS